MPSKQFYTMDKKLANSSPQAKLTPISSSFPAS